MSPQYMYLRFFVSAIVGKFVAPVAINYYLTTAPVVIINVPNVS